MESANCCTHLDEREREKKAIEVLDRGVTDKNNTGE